MAVSVIALNTKSNLYNESTYGFSGNMQAKFGHLSFVDFWAAAILHEIGHAIGNKYGTDPAKGGVWIAPDGDDSAMSVANQDLVVKTCFPKGG